VVDEVMTGFGRTGTWFGVNQWNVVPDIITMAKGLTSGYVPMGAVAISEPIARYFEDRMLSAGLTYSAHPLACAAGIAALRVYEEERLIENSAKLGRVLAGQLQELKSRHRSVGDVRSIGLFAGIELVKDRTTKEPLTSGFLAKACRERGLSTFFPSNLVFVAPPLCITEAELSNAMRILDEVLEIADRQ
jgi:taurine---2-oxoglutarate transaminase